MKRYRSRWPTPINVDLIERQPGEEFDLNPKLDEVKPLLSNGYIEEVKA